MSDLPSPRALFPPSTTLSTAAALRSISAVYTLPRTVRLTRLDAYYRGTQYDAREYAWDGRHIASSEALGGFAPYYPDWVVPLNLRRPPANYLIGRVIVDRFTSLLFGDGSFPEVIVDGDPETEDFLRAVSTAAALPERMTHARNLGGAQGTVVLSYAWVDGLPVVDVHAAQHVVVLRWADPQRHVPHHVVKVWPTAEFAVSPRGELVEQDGWMAREWRGPEGDAPGYERIFAYHPVEPNRPAFWSLEAEAPLSECPIVWIRNEAGEDGHDGESDFEGCEDAIDLLNVILGATSTGTALNADPTLVVKCDPKLNPGRTRKGAFNTIYSPGGAEYLELSGAAVKAGLDNVERVRAYIFETAGVTILDPEKMSGAAQSGEALRRLMAPTLAKADRRRETYGAGIVQVLEGLWRLAKRIEVSPPTMLPALDETGVRRLDEKGQPILEPRRPVLRLPSRRRAVPEGHAAPTEVVTEERRPGAGGAIRLRWPEYFPLTEADRQARIRTLQSANGGHPLLSPTRAIAAAAPIFGVQLHASEELEAILRETAAFADAQAGALGERVRSPAFSSEPDASDPGA